MFPLFVLYIDKYTKYLVSAYYMPETALGVQYYIIIHKSIFPIFYRELTLILV